jgi:hypothetical protein
MAERIVSVMVPDGEDRVTVPFLVFGPEEIAQLRDMLRRSDWACSVTRRMQEYLEQPDVIRFLAKLDYLKKETVRYRERQDDVSI